MSQNTIITRVRVHGHPYIGKEWCGLRHVEHCKTDTTINRG